jgi:hypothetical protein
MTASENKTPRQHQRRKNLAVLAILVGLIALIYVMTIVKMQGG